MKSKNATRNALFSSIIALLLCVSMLVGTTFAWFTDKVESGVNTIAAGNLDVELYYSKTKDFTDKNSVEGKTQLFTDKNGDPITYWEPGVVAYTNLQVANEGTLALKYQLSVNFENKGPVDLSKALQVAVVTGGFEGDRAQAQALTELVPLESFALSGVLEGSTTSEVYGIVIYWEPTDDDNKFNMNNENKGKTLSIDLGVNLFATQEMYENDSFNETYDKDTETFTVAQANAMLAENKDVTLYNCIERDGILVVPANYTGKLILKDSAIKSVQAKGDVNIVILGNVQINAKGSGVATIAEDEFDGCAISANGELSVDGNGKLTAIAADMRHAAGIGGEKTTKITIKNITIADVKGSFVQPDIKLGNYGKNEPEGGAAIGTGASGKEINLEGVTINNAQGGSKAAGIGVRYHCGVVINIKDCVINNVEGGNASAGIGGSRVSDSVAPADQHVKINIENSTINAVGGEHGAGIGSGYDVHCGEKNGAAFITETICTINIDAASNITAKGGKYAAGVGTGYHVAALAGNIECKVNATAGESRERYTVAQAVGFGVVDHKREVAYLNAAPSITYQGNVIAVPGAQITEQAAFAEAVKNGGELYLAAGTFTMPSTSKDVTIVGTKDTKIALPSMAVSGNGNVITFEGVTIEGNMTGNFYSYLFDGAAKVVYKSCEIKGQISTYCNTEFVDCVFTNTFADDYSVYCYSGSTVKFDACTFNTLCSKAIKVYDENNGNRDVYVNNCTFNTETVDKAAVEIDSTYNKGYKIYFTGNNTINGAYTKLWNDKSTNAVVYIDGDDVVNTIKIGTLEELKAFANDVNANGNGYSGKTVVLTANIDLNNEEWTPIGQTGGNGVATYFRGRFDGKGYTISNLKITNNAYDEGKNYAAGFFGFVDAGDANIVNLTIDGANVNGHHWTGVIAGYLTGNISNCTVKNATVTCTHANGDACGDKCGVIVGYVNKGLVARNTAENCTVTAGRDAGQIVGCAKAEYVSDNTATNVTVSATGGCTGANIRNEHIGRVN